MSSTQGHSTKIGRKGVQIPIKDPEKDPVRVGVATLSSELGRMFVELGSVERAVGDVMGRLKTEGLPVDESSGSGMVKLTPSGFEVTPVDNEVK